MRNIIGFALVLTGATFLLESQCRAQSSNSQQIEFLQQQLNQLKFEAESVQPNHPVWYQQPSVQNMSGMPTVPDSASFSASYPPIATESLKLEEKTYPDHKINGFFQLDSARFSQSGESRAIITDIEDGAGFRRARLAATGNVTERGSYLFEFDIAQGQARFVDVWGQVKDTPLGTLRIGRFRQPFGMSELSSVRELPLMERPTIFALAPFRQTGIMFSNPAFDEQATWAVSGFRTISDNFGNVYGDDGGFGTAARLTWLPVDYGDNRLIHFGLDHSYLDPARNQMQIVSQDEIFIGQQPNLGPTGLSVLPIINVPPFVNSGIFDVDHANLFNLEGALSFGRALLQSEYRWSRLALPVGPNATVHGGYATVRYMLTGETIPYNRQAGVFGRVKPNQPLDIREGRLGAWEVAAQLSMIDLNPLFGMPGVTGATRRLKSTSLALNWYWWANGKCQFEWANGSLTDPILGSSISNTFASRVQFDF